MFVLSETRVKPDVGVLAFLKLQARLPMLITYVRDECTKRLMIESAKAQAEEVDAL